MNEQTWLGTADNALEMVRFALALAYPGWEPRYNRYVAADKNLDEFRAQVQMAAAAPNPIQPTPRRLALFAHACCRSIGHLVCVGACRRLLELNERRIEAPIPEDEINRLYQSVSTEASLREAVRISLQTAGDTAHRDRLRACEEACRAAALTSLLEVANDDPEAHEFAARREATVIEEIVGLVRRASGSAAHAAGDRGTGFGPNRGALGADRTMCDLARDVFGNPFHPVAFDPRWRTSTVSLLAQGIYHYSAGYPPVNKIDHRRASDELPQVWWSPS